MHPQTLAHSGAIFSMLGPTPLEAAPNLADSQPIFAELGLADVDQTWPFFWLKSAAFGRMCPHLADPRAILAAFGLHGDEFGRIVSKVCPMADRLRADSDRLQGQIGPTPINIGHIPINFAPHLAFFPEVDQSRGDFDRHRQIPNRIEKARFGKGWTKFGTTPTVVDQIAQSNHHTRQTPRKLLGDRHRLVLAELE